MYCIHCGKWMEGEADICPDCAAAHSAPAEAPAPAAPVYAPPAAPVYAPPAAPVFTAPAAPSYPTEPEDTFRITSPEIPKKKNGKKIALICILAAVAAIAILAVVFWDNITGLFQKDFDTPAEHLQYVEESAMNDGIDALTDSYAQFMTAAETGSTATEAEMHLLLGDDVLALVEAALAQEGIPVGVDWLNDIMLTGTVNGKDDAYQATVGIGLGNTTLLTADIIADIAGDRMWMGFPELSDDYLFFDSVESLAGISLPEMLAASQVSTQELMEALPAPEVLNSLLKKYGTLVIGCVQDVQKGTQTVTQGDFTQEFTTFTAKVTPLELLNMMESILTELKQDGEAQDVLVKYMTYCLNSTAAMSYEYAPGETYTSEAEVRSQLLDAIDQGLAELENLKSDPATNSEGYIQIVTFMDDNSTICGRSFTLYDDDGEEDGTVRYLMVRDDNQFSLEAYIADEVSLIGTGTQQSGNMSGDFTLTADGMDVCHVQLTDIGENGGKIRLRPSRAVLEEILYEAGISGGGIISNMNIVLELELRSDNGTEYLGLKLLMNEELLAGITVSSRQTSAANVRLPSGGVDVMDDEAGMQWLQSLDFSVLMENMSTAGVPNEILQFIAYLAMSMNAGMNTY